MKNSFIVFLTFCLMLTGCSAPVSTPAPTTQPITTGIQETEEIDPLILRIDAMTDEDLAGQLFLASTYRLGEIKPAGIVLFASDIQDQTPESLSEVLNGYNTGAAVPLFFAVDEEGGTVNRVSLHKTFRDTPFSSPRKLMEQGGIDLLLKTETEKAKLLKSVGIHVNLAPVCDITTDSDAFMYERSLGLSPKETGDVIGKMVETANNHQMGTVLKHFPGYGDNTDTHVGIAVDDRPLEQLETVDLVPFQAGIDAGCGAVMVSHTIINAIDETLPASLSPAVHDYLRTDMGFDGVILTDDLIMDAIKDHYGMGEAAVLALLAGSDLLCTSDCSEAYHSVLEAMESGRISRERVESSVLRILQWKQALGIL